MRDWGSGNPMFIRRRFDILIIVLILAGIFCFLSYRPRSRISAQMPVEFLDVSNSENRQQRIAEEKLAKAYWDCVVNTIQWEYTYGYRLPSSPPPEFTVTRGDVPAGSDLAARTRYWQKLQQVWNIPTTWQKQYEWDTAWTTTWTEDLKAVGSWFYAKLPGSHY